MARGEPEHSLERDVPVGAPIVAEDKLVEIGVDVHKLLDRSRGVVRDGGETNATRPSIQVFRLSSPRLGLVGATVDHLDRAGDKDLPGFHRIEKL